MVDTDEVIMPLKHNNWSDMIREINVSNNGSTLVFRHALFLDEEEELMEEVEEEDEMEENIAERLHMMSHVNRSVRYSPRGFNPKSFHSTNRTQRLLAHSPLSCLGPCKRHHVDISLARLNHYRRGCPPTLSL